jgi:putative nucleotidyltransferase with HDIG domain
LAANTAPANLELRVMDSRGHQLLGVGSSAAGPVTLPNIDPQLAPLAPVQDALAGRIDGMGERNVFLDAGLSQPVLYWIGPVWNARGQAVGAILIGESVADIARGISGSSFYDGHGILLSSTLPAAGSLSQTVRQRVTAGQAMRVMEVRDGHQVGTLFSDWTLRGHQLGYLGTSLNADGLTALLAQLRALLAAIFAAAGLGTLLAGALVASWITRPVEELALATRVIAAGDLGYRARVRSKDEVGSLAQSFNHMAASLADKTGQLEDVYFSSMEALARAIDARDPYTFGHSERVAAISGEIAAAMGLDPGARLALRRAALLHDIGKIGIADRVLHKPTQLNDEETGTMQEHPRIGYEMLKGLRFLQPSLAGVLHHHERWNGAGYPDGIAGSGIPLLVRILTVADVFDALTSERPYRRALSPEAATRAITVESGVRYDPDVVTAFVARRQAIAAIVRDVESKAS